MNKNLLFVATAVTLALIAPAPARADDGCVDDGCDLRALYQSDNSQGGSMDGVIKAQRLGSWGIDRGGMDTSVRPGEDFFRYVSGNWATNTKIPSDKSMYGSFLVLRDLSEARLRTLVESYPAGDPATGGDAAKIATLYRGFMDEAAIEGKGIRPVAPHLDAVRAVADKDALARLMGQRMGSFGGTFFSASVSDDQRDPDHYALYLGQAGLGLGDREMYLDPKFAPQRGRYEAYIAQMLGLAGWADPKVQAGKIMAMETRIAKVHWTRAESRDRDKTYNPVPLGGMDAMAPGFPWATYFAAAGVNQARQAVVRQNTAFPKMAAIFADTDLDTLKAWQAFHTVDDAAPLLSKAFVDAEFEFRSKFLSGQPEQRPRWKRGVAFAEGAMGEAIGRDFVDLYFPADAKAKMDDLVANVKAAMGARLQQLDWMSPATKAEAHAKLKKFTVKIGYPDKW
nr:M13 family metallopeptidase [Pseudomonadota bacterium]